MAVQDPALDSNGIKIGDGRLHPFIDLELRYDSYAGLVPPAAAAGSRVPLAGADKNSTSTDSTVPFQEFLLHLRPGLKFDLPYPNFDFTIGGEVDEVLYTSLLLPGDTAGFSRLDYNANMGLAINRPGAVEVDISDTLTHNDRTNNAATSVGVVSLYNTVALAVPIHPGGRALEITPHGAFNFEDFTPIECAGEGVKTCTDPTNVRAENYEDVNFGVDGRLLFLPKTAIILQTDYDTRFYPNDPGLVANKLTGLLNVSAGIAGLLTTRIAVLARIGYAYDFLGSNLSTVIGQGELSYLPNEYTTLKVGFVRSAQPVPQYGTYVDNRPYIDLRTLLVGRLALHLNAGYDLLDFSQVHGVANFSRQDQVVTVDAGPQYEFTRWLIGSLGIIDSYRVSNVPGELNNFNRLEAYLRLTFTY